MGKNQFSEADPFPITQQTVRLVLQSRASLPSPMSSRVTQLLFWYVIPLSENHTSPANGKKVIQMSPRLCIQTCSVHIQCLSADNCYTLVNDTSEVRDKFSSYFYSHPQNVHSLSVSQMAFLLLYYTVLHYTVLYYTILYYTIL